MFATEEVDFAAHIMGARHEVAGIDADHFGGQQFLKAVEHRIPAVGVIQIVILLRNAPIQFEDHVRRDEQQRVQVG